ncbi:winged helix-turn-helix transcriptional regulator [Bradyrhizobium manausense]|uniref:winged helix-turn-helix transcriptional regulator n=1 Tax=Bradyrhizobium manausense TaxID=989370 RepID=UPI001BA85FB1|nr:winged helix-turn-helix transcriptional regulator [Bradyrhizobium manausense]
MIGDPWSFLVHQEAFFGVRRFDDFQRNLNVARNTLTDRLALLVRHGLLKKDVYLTRPQRYEYRLTQRGLDTYPYALALTQWGDQWLSGTDGPPIMLRHITCGKPLVPLGICGSCRRRVHPEDVLINPTSLKGPAPTKDSSLRYSSRPELYTAGRQTSVGRTLAAVGDRWGFFLLWLALAGISKFDHFHRILGIARTTLTARLERLTHEGFLERTLYQSRPARYGYHLTEKGRAFTPVLLTLFEWGKGGPGADAGDVSVLHKACGDPLQIQMVCEHCKEIVDPRDVKVIERPLGQPAKEAR